MTTIEFQHGSAAAVAPRQADAFPTGGGAGETAFATLLDVARGPDAEAQVREAATQFVASAFILPVLEQMHESPFAAEPFAPNAAQRRFAPLFDQQIADRVTGAAQFPLVDGIVEQVMNAAGAKGGVDVRA